MSEISDKIKNAKSLSEWFAAFGCREVNGKTGRFMICCPFHGERSPSLEIDDTKGLWHCFGGCYDPKGGDAFTAAIKYQFGGARDFNDALERMAEYAGIPYSRSDHNAPLYAIVECAVEYYHGFIKKERAGAATREYLIDQRHFTKETIKRWRLGYAPESEDNLYEYLVDHGFTPDDIFASGLVRKREDKIKNEYWYVDRLSNRIVFPIFNRGGKPVALAGRIMPDEPDRKPKYLNTAGSAIYNKSATLYGLNFARDAIVAADNAVLVEGYTDAIMADQCGVGNVVAICGTAATEYQISQLLGLTSRVTLMLDPDKAGADSTINIIPKLQVVGGKIVDLRVLVSASEQIDETTVVGLDPDEWIFDNPESFRIASQDWSESAFDTVVSFYTKDLDKDAPLTERQAIADKLAQLAITPHETQTQANLARIRQLLQVSVAKPRVVRMVAGSAEAKPPPLEDIVLGYAAGILNESCDGMALAMIQRFMSAPVGLVTSADFPDFDTRAIWMYLDTAIDLEDAGQKLTPEQLTKLEMLLAVPPDPVIFQRTMVQLRRRTLSQDARLMSVEDKKIDEMSRIGRRLSNMRKMVEWSLQLKEPLLEFDSHRSR